MIHDLFTQGAARPPLFVELSEHAKKKDYGGAHATRHGFLDRRARDATTC